MPDPATGSLDSEAFIIGGAAKIASSIAPTHTIVETLNASWKAPTKLPSLTAGSAAPA
jgi:hypothetical protein